VLVAQSYNAPDWQVREAARKALKVASLAALPALERRLNDRRWQVRRHIAQLLDNALDDTNVHVLLKALKDPNAIVRRNALHSLTCEDCKTEGCWTVDMTGVLLDIVKTDRSPRVRVAAIAYLSHRPPQQRIVETLRQVGSTSDHARVRSRCQRVADAVSSALATAEAPTAGAADAVATDTSPS
jgi:HEAT repeat protein